MIMLEFHFYDDFDDDKLFDESKCAKLCTVTAEKIIECIVRWCVRTSLRRLHHMNVEVQ